MAQTAHKQGNIGHRIPLSKYNANDEDDFRRCWTKANLFAQCAKENNDNRDAMPPDHVLQPLKSGPLRGKSRV